MVFGKQTGEEEVNTSSLHWLGRSTKNKHVTLAVIRTNEQSEIKRDQKWTPSKRNLVDLVQRAPIGQTAPRQTDQHDTYPADRSAAGGQKPSGGVFRTRPPHQPSISDT